MIPSRVTNLAQAREHSGAYADHVVRMLTQGDELADAAVMAMEGLGHGPGMRMLDRILDRGIAEVPEAPPAFVRLFEQVDRVPTWVDWDRMALGARTYQRTGMAGSLALSAVSLMNGYHSSAAIKPLLFTGRLDAGTARRRLAETGRFITDTIQTDGLRRDRMGFKSSVKVRMIHAFVRRLITRSGRWDASAWGTPINQADMASTNLSFSIAMVHSVRQLGMRISREEADALIHLWRYSGYLSGVDLSLLPTTEEEAWYRAELMDMLQPGFDEGSIELARALRSVASERRGDPVMDRLQPVVMRVHDALTRIVIGDEKADHLQTPHRDWVKVLERVRPFVDAAERVRESLPFATRAASELGNLVWLGLVDQELGDHPASFVPPQTIAKADRFAARTA